MHDCETCPKQGKCDQETVLRFLTDIHAKSGVDGMIPIVMGHFKWDDEKYAEIFSMYLDSACSVIGIENTKELKSFTDGCRAFVPKESLHILNAVLKMQAFSMADWVYSVASEKIRGMITAMNPSMAVSFDVSMEERQVALPPVRVMH